MPFFEGGVLPEEIVAKDVEYLSRLFAPWRERHDLWDDMLYPPDDVDVIGLRNTGLSGSKPRDERRSQSQYRTNFVRKASDDLINSLSATDPLIEVQNKPNDSQVEMEKGAKVERFCRGILQALEEEAQQLAMGTSWLRRVHSYAACPGKLVARIHVRATPPTNTGYVEWELFDPYMVAHEFSRGLRRLSSQATISGLEALSLVERFRAESEGDESFLVAPHIPTSIAGGLGSGEVNRVEYWVEEWDYKNGGGFNVYNGLLLGNETIFLRKMSRADAGGFDRMPIIVITMNTFGRSYQKPAIGSSGMVTGSGADSNRARPRSAIERHAEPWFAPLEKVIPHFNLVKSLEIDSVDWKVHPPIITRGENGTFVVEDRRLGPGVQIPLEPGQVMQFLELQSSAIEVNSTLVADLKKEMERAGPWALLRDVPFADPSGFLYSLFSTQVEKSTQDYAQGAAAFLKWGFLEAIHQFKHIPGLEIKLKGISYKGTEQAHLFEEDFKASDFPESITLNVKLAPMLPKDDMRAIQIYQMAIDPDSGGMDQLTAMSQILGIRDPVAVRKRRLQDRIEASEESLVIAKWDDLRQKIAALHAEAASRTKLNERLAIQKQATLYEELLRQFEARYFGANPAFQQEPLPGLPAPSEQAPQERGIQNPQVQATALGGRNLTQGARGPARNGGTPR